MNEGKAFLGIVLFGLAKICRFNAFAGAFCGIVYGLIANLFDREFLGFGSTQLSLLGIGCFIDFFALSIRLVAVGNGLVTDAEPQTKNDSQA